MKKWLASVDFRLWLAVAGSGTLIIGAAYAMVQQSARQAADDLPLQNAQTIAHQLSASASPQDVVPSVKTNLRADNTAFAIIVDSNQEVLASSATLDGKTPLPPEGVFQFTSAHGTDHFTWEPASGVRLATRVQTYADSNGNGFIVTGQSLKQAENRIEIYGDLALAAWLAMLAWITLVLFFWRGSPKSKE